MPFTIPPHYSAHYIFPRHSQFPRHILPFRHRLHVDTDFLRFLASQLHNLFPNLPDKGTGKKISKKTGLLIPKVKGKDRKFFTMVYDTFANRRKSRVNMDNLLP